MRTIKFNDHSYELINNVVKESTRIRFVIPKGELTLAQVAPTVTGVNEILVLDGDEVVSVYTGYTSPVALNVFNDYPISIDAKEVVISVELENVNFQSQIDALSNQINTQGAEIADIEEAVDTLSESQETQDLAIEDLAEAVNDLTPEEE